MQIFTPDAGLDAHALDAAIAASSADLVLHVEPGFAYAPDHADALSAAIGEAAMVHPLAAQLHPGGLIAAAPAALASDGLRAILDAKAFPLAPRAICAYRRDAYLAQDARWSAGAAEEDVWSGLIEAGDAALCPRVTALQLQTDEAPPDADWTGQALFGGWLMNLLDLSDAPPPRHTDAALARFGFPGTAGDDWFDETVALDDRQKSDLRAAFQAWRTKGRP